MSDDLHGRRRILPIEFETIVAIMQGRIAIQEGLPRDARIVGVQPLTMFNMIEFAIESSEFRRLRPGEMMERVLPICHAIEPRDLIEWQFRAGLISRNEMNARCAELSRRDESGQRPPVNILAGTDIDKS
jgi:hypothetical protein